LRQYFENRVENVHGLASSCFGGRQRGALAEPPTRPASPAAPPFPSRTRPQYTPHAEASATNRARAAAVGGFPDPPTLLTAGLKIFLRAVENCCGAAFPHGHPAAASNPRA